jgi:hypothetical protein
VPFTGDLFSIGEGASRPYVFHLDGEHLGDFKRSWATACRKAGVGKVLVHDLRRTAVRNMMRESPIRSLWHSLDSRPGVFLDRYNIVTEADLAQATQRLQAHLRTQKKARKVLPIAGHRRVDDR